ncbi:isochorismatase family cysteine hydrolase [Actinocorallia sp. A-T 12471]|uniref:cysteine hydrolase family protein n=1 Tax=Actinocorallia sp. A-T 12471 TaxID=3089813 RepID=UPI0029CD9CE1|nr:isochorismatase family cysteine hydrolase [Actinocorallia sp. A-T 12471]MDX6739642.1 isochorismatase family cysteine hydrolase [Actinocorallia sp. A-T 12471]
MTENPGRTALLMLDYQTALCECGEHMRMPPLVEQVERRGVLAAAEKTLAAARDAGLYVVHVRLAFDPSYELRTNRSARFDVYPRERAMLRDAPGARIVSALAPLPHEPVVDKGGVGAFVGTPLLEMLLGAGVRHVVLGGVATNLVVESTARHAVDSGLAVTVLEDLCASFDPALHDVAVTKILPMFAAVRASAEFIAEL